MASEAQTAVRLVIPGRPITKKNHAQIVRDRRTGRRRVIPSEAYKAYEAAASWELVAQMGPGWTPISAPVHVQAVYWMPNRRSWPDLLGLEEATADILEAVGVIEDDKQIVSWDGSRIAGVDKARPRVEIELVEREGAS